MNDYHGQAIMLHYAYLTTLFDYGLMKVAALSWCSIDMLVGSAVSSLPGFRLLLVNTG